ncbi:MAG: hypothetical protein IJ215_03125 [Clostridia bacterium]|nr:hypothetical protein [Clostridia bacterium]
MGEEQIITREKYSQNKNTNDKVIIILMIVLLISSFLVFQSSITKAQNSTDDLLSMESPIQNNLVSRVIHSEKINGIDVTITNLAKYQISGRVVAEYDYTSGVAGIVQAISSKDYYNDISCKDVAIAYGPMALLENHRRMQYIMSGSRRVLYTIKDTSLVQDVGTIETVGPYITNNHLIASNTKILDLIKKIDKDDYVQITGYLVRVEWEKGMYRYVLESSMSREDTGSNACEVIYVEDVKWIK